MKLTHFLIIGAAAVLLSGCVNTAADDINLTKNTLNDTSNQDQRSLSQIADNTNNLPSDISLEEGNNQITEGTANSMKTLSDFTPIEAEQVTLTTTKGDIIFTLYRDEAPLTTLNFLNLAQDGFYDNIVFHRVIPDFMAQVGDPLTKDPAQQARWGTGDPGYKIADEFHPNLKHDQAGVVSMANSGPNTGGSQFFITYEPTPWLDGKHAIFGQVTAGMDVLAKIEVGDKIISVSYQ